MNVSYLESSRNRIMMSDEDKNKIIAAHTINACKAVKISFVSPLEYETEYFDKQYKPEMTHQIFGLTEKIFGYKDLEIKIVYNETSGHCLVKIDYTSIVSDTLGLVADDVWNKLRKALPEDFSRDSFEYSKIHKNKEVYLKAFGIPKYQFACQIDRNQHAMFIATLCSTDEDGFKQVHDRFQTLILWYIDGANLIDLDDSKWQIIYLYTYRYGRKGPPSVIGFCTVYKFFAYPDQIRARISQFIIYPPYRRSGVGVRFLRCVYNIIRDTIPNLKDITVEDPNEKFRMIRAINNVTAVFFSPTLTKLKLNEPKNTDFINELTAVFKFNRNESYVITDLIIYMCANFNENKHIQEQVISRLKQRFGKEYVKIVKCYRHSIKFNRYQISQDSLNKEFQEYETEFLAMATTIASKVIDNIRLTKIE